MPIREEHRAFLLRDRQPPDVVMQCLLLLNASVTAVSVLNNLLHAGLVARASTFHFNLKLVIMNNTLCLLADVRRRGFFIRKSSNL